MYGVGVPELVKVAVRALSAPIAAGAGERNQSTYGFIVSRLRKKQNFFPACQEASLCTKTKQPEGHSQVEASRLRG
jgi:hypothetical protein